MNDEQSKETLIELTKLPYQSPTTEVFLMEIEQGIANSSARTVIGTDTNGTPQVEDWEDGADFGVQEWEWTP